MSNLDAEEQQYREEVEAVKQWWTDPRWRYTKRPFTAEQIVQKRGQVKIQYPSNLVAKKLWQIVEARFKVPSIPARRAAVNDSSRPSERRCKLYLRLP